ncbi:MAG: hypothetical protein LN417_09955 [Candidatus Thermoplasmatota archaeon]|nr:hypothetical protein [Candidatus Thermoplasmatota archaeon]
MAASFLHDLWEIDLEEIGEQVAPAVTEVLSSRIEKLHEIPEEKVEEWFKKQVEPHIEAIRDFFEELDLLRTRVLLEQAIVTAVTALEVYLQDITVSAVKLNKFIESRFHEEIERELGRRTLHETSDSREVLGLAASRSFTPGRPSDVRRHFRRMVGKDIILTQPKDARTLNRIVAYRNVIVHQGGVVDEKFRSMAQYTGRIGEPVQLTRRRVENAIRFIEGLVVTVDSEIRQTRPPKK